METSHEVGQEEAQRAQMLSASCKSRYLDSERFCLSLLLLNALWGEVKARGPVFCLGKDPIGGTSAARGYHGGSSED